MLELITKMMTELSATSATCKLIIIYLIFQISIPKLKSFSRNLIIIQAMLFPNCAPRHKYIKIRKEHDG
jgi:hypothetical protein